MKVSRLASDHRPACCFFPFVGDKPVGERGDSPAASEEDKDLRAEEEEEEEENRLAGGGVLALVVILVVGEADRATGDVGFAVAGISHGALHRP